VTHSLCPTVLHRLVVSGGARKNTRSAGGVQPAGKVLLQGTALVARKDKRGGLDFEQGSVMYFDTLPFASGPDD